LPRDYEILYIVRPELDDQQVQEAVGSVNRLIENVGGTVVKTDVWGRRKLAYEVRHLREGHYVLTDFKAEPQAIPEMEATLKISDTVFRHLIVRKPDKPRRGVRAQPTAPAQPPEAVSAETVASSDVAEEEPQEPQEPEVET
jgi:small subunit ribosomal protein S6